MLQELNQRFAIGEQLKFVMHPSGLVQGCVDTDSCTGSFYLLGAHIATFQPRSQSQPVLFMSEDAVFELGKPIRGGIPICFPWFGANKADASGPAHGVVRTAVWEVLESQQSERGVLIRFGYQFASYDVMLTVIFGETLDVSFTARNGSTVEQECEVALHTYFQLGDSRRASIIGLEQNEYRDQLTGQVHAASGTAIQFSGETDRVYRGSVSVITIEDNANERRIIIAPRNSQSTVVWNPWIDKSQRLSDFGDQEFERMCCVETANVAPQNWIMAGGESRTVGITISVSELHWDPR